MSRFKLVFALPLPPKYFRYLEDRDQDGLAV